MRSKSILPNQPAFRPASWLTALLALLLILGAPGPAAFGGVSREYEIKAAYLYNFINYIEWPDQSLPPAGGTITIGVLGENPFGGALAPLNGKQTKGRTLAVKELATIDDL